MSASLVLYLGGALLVLGLGRRVGLGRGAVWAAALWLAAPVHVQAVLDAPARRDLLSLVLELAGLWLALDALAKGRWAWARAVGGCVLVAAAVLSGVMAVTAPALLALLAGVTGTERRRWEVMVAAVGVAALLALAARLALGQGIVTGGGVPELALVPWRLGAYLLITLAPLGHSPAYLLAPPGTAWLALAWVGLAAATLALVVRAAPLVRMGALWFAVALAPALFSGLADRFALLPSVGLAWLVPVAITALARRWRPLGVLAPALLLAAYTTGTLIESRAWRDDLTLWSRATARAPRSAHAHHRHALALETRGRFSEAAAAAAEAVTWDPTLGPAYALYGRLVLRRGDIEQATHALSRAQRYAPKHPDTSDLENALSGRLTPSSPPAR